MGRVQPPSLACFWGRRGREEEGEGEGERGR